MKSTADYLKELDNFFENLPEEKEYTKSLEEKVLEDFHGNVPIFNNSVKGKLPTITDAAKKYIVDNSPQGHCFTFRVSGGGCSGFNYEFDVLPVEEITDNDIEISKTPFAVVDKESLPFVYGTTIDIKVTGLTTAFTVDNPGAKASCGCGTSFAFNEELLI